MNENGNFYAVGNVAASQAFPKQMNYLKTNRSMIKTLLLSLITLGIYGLIVDVHVGEEMNIVASRYDGKSTMSYWIIAFLLNPVTCGIANYVWLYLITKRMGDELRRRNIQYSFDTSSFWLWMILGSMFIVGPFIYRHMFFKAMNYINESFNFYG